MSIVMRTFTHSDTKARSLACTFTGENFLIEHRGGWKQTVTPANIFQEIIWPLTEKDFDPIPPTEATPPDAGVTILMQHEWLPLMPINYQRELGIWIDKGALFEPQISDAISARSDILSALSILIEEFEPPCQENDDVA